MSEKMVLKQLIIYNFQKMKQLRVNTQVLHLDIGGGGIPLERTVNITLNLPVL